MNDIVWFRTVFKKYVDKFYGKDEYLNTNIKIKEEHTFRVCKNIKKISHSLNSNEQNLCLSEIIALFHDIGRFEQIVKYRTFNDKISENHAELGIKVIEKEGFFQSLNPDLKNICINAILYHNKKNLYESDPNDKTILFSKMIRDADKMDILKVLTNYYDSDNSSNPALVLDLSDDNKISYSLLKDFLEGKKLDSVMLKTKSDFKILMLSWAFDLNFDFTKRYILKNGYFEKIIETLPDNSPKNEIRIVVKKAIYVI